MVAEGRLAIPSSSRVGRVRIGAAASVGRKSGAPSAASKGRAYFWYAGSSPQSGSGRNLLLYSEPARPRSDLLVTQIDMLRNAVRRVRPHAFPHRRLGCPPLSSALPMDLATRRRRFPVRWRAIKTAFVKCLPTGESRSPVMTSRGERGIWQWRYWERTIRDDRDVAAHMDDTHFNPVKHGLVEHPADWPHSSFRRCVDGGLYPAGWRDGSDKPQATGERL
jgi:putative transposase